MPMTASQTGMAVQSDSGFDAVAWPAGTKLSAALEASTRWQLAYADEQSVLYVRRVPQ